MMYSGMISFEFVNSNTPWYERAYCHLNAQRTCTQMLHSNDGDIFYSRSDLHLLIQSHREKARNALLEVPSQDPFFHRVNNNINRIIVNQALMRSISFPLDLISLLLKDYPQALVEEDTRNISISSPLALYLQHPIHIACMYYFDVVSHLLNLSPIYATIMDEEGRLPIHLAIIYYQCNHIPFQVLKDEEDITYRIIDKLLRCYPSSLTVPFPPRNSEKKRLTLLELLNDETSFRGFLPFHLAATNNLPLSILYLLLRNEPALVFPLDVIRGN